MSDLYRCGSTAFRSLNITNHYPFGMAESTESSQGSDFGTSGGPRPGTTLERDAADTLAAIVQSSDAAIYSKDARAVITSWNPAAERLYGYGVSEALGSPVSMLVPPSRKREEQDILRRVLGGERIEYFETQRLRKDGAMVDVSVTISPVRNAAGDIVEASVIARDIGERKRTEEALLAAHEAEAAKTAIQEFVAVATHDLRLPLSLVGGMATALKESWGTLSDDQKIELLGNIERSARHMARLVEDLLMLSKAELDELRPAKDVVSIGEFVSELARHFPGDLVLKPIPEDVAVHADPDHLRRILTNYITNARTHGAPPIEIATDSVGAYVEICVSDSGPGVDEELTSALFSKFTRGPSVSKSESTGLGLAIVRSLARANGGEAWYEPNRPRGSRFCVRLRSAPPPP